MSVRPSVDSSVRKKRKYKFLGYFTSWTAEIFGEEYHI